MSPKPDGSVPRPTLRDLLHGNVLWLSIISLLNDVASEMVYPLMPAFLVALGAGPTFVGLVEGIAETTASFVKLAGGRLADRYHKRKLLAVWGYGLSTLTRPLLPLARVPAHVLAIRFGDRIGKGIRTAPRDALLAESVPAERRATAFGLHRAADHAGAVMGPLLATGILLMYPGRLRLVFWLAVIPAAIGVFVLIARVKETAVARSAKNAETISLRALGPVFARYLFVVVVFTLGNATDAFLLLRAQSLGVSVALLPILWSALHVSKMGWNVVGGMLSDRYGARPSIISGWIVYALVYAGFAAASSALHVWLLFIVYGLFYGLTEPSEKALVVQLSPAEARGSALGAYHFAIGLAALPGSVLFGWLWQHYSAELAFLVGGGLALAAAVLLAIAVPLRHSTATAGGQ